MPKERSLEEIIKDLITGQRSREDIAENLSGYGSTEEHTRRLILEVLLDIRDLLKELKEKKYK